MCNCCCYIILIYIMCKICDVLSMTWGMYFKCAKLRNRSQTAEFETMYSIMYFRDRKLQMWFSQFEPFYHRHVQCEIPVATHELGS